jgi:DNA polymerase-1
MKKPKIIIDANALAWKSKHSLKDLSHEELSVGVIFGFMGQILRIAEDYQTNDISFCWDSKNNKRFKLFPAYKEKRRTLKEEKTPEEIEEDRLAYLQFDLLYDEVLPLLGVTNNYKIDGYEGDDLIGSIVYSNQNDDFIIATGDEDMFQLLMDGVSIRRSRTNKRGKKEYYLFTMEMFMEEYGIGPLQWIDVKALAGCKSDEVPGIKGIGPPTAIDFLKGNLTPNHKRYQSIVSPEGKAVRKRNEALVTLPFKGCPDIVLNKQSGWSFDGFVDVCNRFDFRYYLGKDVLNKWKIALNLK